LAGFGIFSSNPLILHTVPPLTMSVHRPHSALGISSQETMFDTENPRCVTLDPSVMHAQSETNRAQTPIPGLEYSAVRKMKLKFDTGAKIINLIMRVPELETSTAVDEAHLSELVDFVLYNEVTSYLV
jgi:hypothetical protein